MGKESPAIKIVIILTVFALSLAGISCKKENAATKQNLPPGQEAKEEALRKGLQEAKQVIVATVNGVGIPMSDLIREMNALAPSYIKPGEKRDPDLDKKIRDEALDGLIRDELVHQEAIRQGMKVSPETVEGELKKIKAGLQSEQAYQENLRRLDVTEDEMKSRIERKLLDGMISQKEIYDKVKIDPKMVRRTYEKERASYKGPSGQMSFEEARPLIEQKLMTEAAQKREDAWIKSLSKAAKIDITLGTSAKAIEGVY
jgi:hypothetical protein